jgi:hypothetical protein
LPRNSSSGQGELEGEKMEKMEVEMIPLTGLDHGKLLKAKSVFQLIKLRLLL